MQEFESLHYYNGVSKIALLGYVYTNISSSWNEQAKISF